MYDYLNTALNAGEIMLRNGSDTNRVQRIIELILDQPTVIGKDIIVIGTAIIITVRFTNRDPITMTRVIEKRMHNLQKLTLVTRVAEKVSIGTMTLPEANLALEEINSKITYSIYQKVIAISTVSALFTLGFGGTFDAALIIALITIIPAFFMQYSYMKNLPFFLSNIIAGALVSTLSLLVLSIHPLLHFDKMLSSVIVIFTPGIMAITAIRDVVNGDFITGASRGIESIMLAAGLSIGVGVIFAFYVFITGGIIWRF